MIQISILTVKLTAIVDRALIRPFEMFTKLNFVRFEGGIATSSESAVLR
jgi:hypothetical protein